MEQPGYEKRGYLREDFRLFHLTSCMTEAVGWHYHAFHKLCVYLGGDAIRYGIEGRSYALEPGDLIITMGAGDVTAIGPELLAALKERELEDRD